MVTTLDDLRRFTVARNCFQPTSLKRAVHKMGFVQADPIRAPARAQDLILRHRVKNYHAGDLERRYASLEIDEDVFVNYGFVTRSLQALMHPRVSSRVKAKGKRGNQEGTRAELLLEFVRERSAVHPREVDDHFSHGSVTNYWGGSSNATTRLLEEMHYHGLLRVVRREKGIRLYAAHRHEVGPDNADERRSRIDALVDAVVRIYAPLPGPSLSYYVRRLRYASPQWQTELTSALERAKERLAHARVNEMDWYWPREEDIVSRQSSATSRINDTVRLLAPFDPLVHDRARFELLWGWSYRFEAYTPASKRKLGYYALPMLWRDRVIGWANLSVKAGELNSEFGYVTSEPRDRFFKRELKAEIDGMRVFLRLGS
ncbi:MAG TPA: crosslink repair DNA glycosylase YcaQ family protein [Pyrinomonadaceae bacterium]|nr:crosslink repair DNA glycosylase YcaQ family protein [Pyrinomonadaceae bacterium]